MKSKTEKKVGIGSFKPKKYKCKKHGVTENIMHIYTSMNTEKQSCTRYCLECLKIVLDKIIGRMEEVKEEKE